jgi:hypothetical protein
VLVISHIIRKVLQSETGSLERWESPLVQQKCQEKRRMTKR